MADISKLKVAAGSLVTFGGVDLGHTVDGTELVIERSFAEVKSDLYGDTPIDYVLSGQKASVKMKLAQIDADTLKYLMQEADYETGSVNDTQWFGTKAGASLRSNAYQLVITPQGGNSDGSLTITLFKAVQVGNISLAYKIDEQSVWDGLEFVALVDESRGNGRLLGRFGPSTIS